MGVSEDILTAIADRKGQTGLMLQSTHLVGHVPGAEVEVQERHERREESHQAEPVGPPLVECEPGASAEQPLVPRDVR